jgi:hypothetical protein
MPFIIFHDSQRANDIIQSIMLIVEQGGDLPKRPFANIYTNCMIGSHADIVLSDLIIKHENNTHLNMTQVIQALRKVANQVQQHDSSFDPPTYIKYPHIIGQEMNMICFSSGNFTMLIDLILPKNMHVGYSIMFIQQNSMEYRATMIMVQCQHGTFLLVWVSIHWSVHLLIYSVALPSIVSPFAAIMVNVH